MWKSIVPLALVNMVFWWRAEEVDMEWKKYVLVDPNICHGRACIRGTRVPVSVVLDNLAAGVPEEEVVRSYPSISHDHVLACIAYGAELAREQVLVSHAA